MRRVTRTPLPPQAQTYLDKRQSAANLRRASGSQNIENEWNTARQTKAVRAVVKTLQRMTGSRERCMYCVDSHGSDIDHFRPKARFPGRAFQWSNMLLCCTECGRFKGSRFPMTKRRALLIDPTTEDPWRHLDFDPDTGNLTARFDIEANDWSEKGSTTVDVLQLDRREAMAKGYAITYQRLADIMQTSFASLSSGAMTATTLLAELRTADDHGLLPWCFRGTGMDFEPFCVLHRQYPRVWRDCLTGVR